MSEDPFEGPKLKIERAERHIADYRAAFKVFAEANSDRLPAQLDPETGQPQLVFYGREFSGDMRLTAADALYNLRSALDQATCRCAALAGKSPKGTYFPHGADEAGFKESVREKCKKVPKPVRDAIAALQPYYGGDGALLRALHDLNLVDKHTELLSANTLVTKITLHKLPAPADRDGSEYAGKRFAPDDEVTHYVEVAAKVAFAGVELVGRESATQVLFQLRDAVTNTVAVIEAAMIQHLASEG